jgi:hypothetical protein
MKEVAETCQPHPGCSQLEKHQIELFLIILGVLRAMV